MKLKLQSAMQSFWHFPYIIKLKLGKQATSVFCGLKPFPNSISKPNLSLAIISCIVLMFDYLCSYVANLATEKEVSLQFFFLGLRISADRVEKEASVRRVVFVAHRAGERSQEKVLIERSIKHSFENVFFTRTSSTLSGETLFQTA